MRARLRSRRLPTRKYLVVAIIIALLAISVMIFLGYWLKWDWTGFSEHIGPNVQQYQPAKTLWDWLNLLGVLAIPAAVGLGTIWFTSQQAKVSDAENKDNQRETALQAYIDKMSELLLEKGLRGSAEDDEVRKVARARTLTILARLDANRKRSVLQFLHESSLILIKGNPIVDLGGADLSNGNLVEAYLSNSYLPGVDLSNANLREALLVNAYLVKANLSRASLYAADLRFSCLREANLRGADLRATLNHADLREADLSGADLSGATLVEANLTSAIGITSEELEKQAKSLQGATMPDGSIHS